MKLEQYPEVQKALEQGYTYDPSRSGPIFTNAESLRFFKDDPEAPLGPKLELSLVFYIEGELLSIDYCRAGTGFHRNPEEGPAYQVFDLEGNILEWRFVLDGERVPPPPGWKPERRD